MFKIQHSIKLISILTINFFAQAVWGQPNPADINFVRQGVKRLIFDQNQSISIGSLKPEEITGFASMHPNVSYSAQKAQLSVDKDLLTIESKHESKTGIWFGGFNPFYTFQLEVESCYGNGSVGFDFTSPDKKDHFLVTVGFDNGLLTGAQLKVIKDSVLVTDKSVAVNIPEGKVLKGQFILQMLGSGFVLYFRDKGLPIVIGQSDFNQHMDLRKNKIIHSFQSHLYAELNDGKAAVKRIESVLSTGVGLADIRAITYENGDPLLDQGRLWYTMSIRGRALPHHIQGVFSMNPGVFDLRLEGIIVFDRNDGILRNEIASHIYYDRNHKVWRGITTGFSAYANPQENKQLLAIESKKDPRFGYSVMGAAPFGMIGDIEDPHIIYDTEAEKWRILTCINQNGYKAVVLESDQWNKGYEQIAGPVKHNSTGTSIQKIGNKRYCFSGSSQREVFVYSYPDLKEIGTLNMDLPPWDETSGTRVWPNVVQLPEDYPVPYVALMMDRYNFPGMEGPHWSYGALYLYHGYN